MWSIGTIFGELLQCRPLLQGDNEMDQLQKIFHLIGAPNKRIWPDMDNMPLIRENKINLIVEQQKHPYNNLKLLFPELSDEGFELMNRLMAYDPKQRITAKAAMDHDYFNSRPYPCLPEYMVSYHIIILFDVHNILQPTFPPFHKG